MYVCPIPIAASPTCAAGPATAQLAWVDDFIADAVEAGAPPDFISSHLYPTDPWANEQALSHGRDDFFGAIESAANNVATAGRKHGLPSTTPFLLTEFSEYLNNVMNSLAFLQHTGVIFTVQRCPSLSYMSFVCAAADCGLGLDCADSFYSASFIAYHALKSQDIVGRVPVQS